jgi:mRNA interferase MazF
VVKAEHPKRGDVWMTRLDPTIGNEIQKTRPCLVISPDSMNKYLGTVIMMPMTSGSHKSKFRLQSIFAETAGLLLGDQIRSVSKYRLVKNLGPIDDVSLDAALALLREMFET